MFWYRLISFDRNIHHSVSFRNCSKIVEIVFFVNFRIFRFLDWVSIFSGLFNAAVKNAVKSWNVVIPFSITFKMVQSESGNMRPVFIIQFGFRCFWPLKRCYLSRQSLGGQNNRKPSWKMKTGRMFCESDCSYQLEKKMLILRNWTFSCSNFSYISCSLALRYDLNDV